MTRRGSLARGDDESLAVSCSKLLVHRIATFWTGRGMGGRAAWAMGRGVWVLTSPQVRHDSDQTHLGNELPIVSLSLSMLDHPPAAKAATDTRQAQARG